MAIQPIGSSFDAFRFLSLLGTAPTVAGTSEESSPSENIAPITSPDAGGAQTTGDAFAPESPIIIDDPAVIVDPSLLVDPAITPEPTDPVEPPAPAPTDIPSDATPVDADNSGTQQQRGVIRLLAAGHFHGVADVRLRTIFADELTAAGIELPEPSPPHGNGRAYAKHLAAYNAARSPAPPLDQPA